MAVIKPFCGFYYNSEKIISIASVICPPYDIISTSQQEYYHRKSPYNIIHLELGREISGEDKYKQAKRYFNKWIEDKILIQDSGAAIYFYQQQFNLKGEKKERLGFIALLRLEDKEGQVFPHEHTRLEPKEDRLQLLRVAGANLSPIFVLFNDKKRIIKRTYEQYLKNTRPFIDMVDDEKISHKVWRVDAPDILNLFATQMNIKDIFIADGHHRYEVAVTFKEEMRRKFVNLAPERDFNYIMSYFTNIESRGLIILALHRLVKCGPDFSIDRFKVQLKEYFDIQEVKEKDNFFFLLEKAGSTQNSLGMYIHKEFCLLRLKNVKILDREIADKPKEYRSLDIGILNFIILRKILNLDLEDREKIRFNSNSDELIRWVDADKNSMAFFLNPVKIEQMVSIAVKGQRLPAKSTYFYPKVPAGLVINKFS